jgi:hypothetical protein
MLHGTLPLRARRVVLRPLTLRLCSLASLATRLLSGTPVLLARLFAAGRTPDLLERFVLRFLATAFADLAIAGDCHFARGGRGKLPPLPPEAKRLQDRGEFLA